MSSSSRFHSLDVFRGMDVALMIIVNSLGSYETAWSPLLHAEWDGFTLTDLVFPTFLFVVGNSMYFSLGKYQSLGTGAVLSKILKRTAIIFLLGYLMYWFPFFNISETGDLVFRSWSHTRIFGVLQRIALCYGLVALVVHFFNTRGAIAFGILSMVGYQLILWLFGDLSMAGNAGTKLDLWLLGPDHLYHGEGIPFDPEGLLSTFPSTVNVIAGYLTAKFIKEKGIGFETIAKMMIIGAILLLAAQWLNLFLPINKKLWSTSYVFHTVGLDLLVLPIVIYVIEHAGRKAWTPFFEVFGKNTLFIYLLSEFIVIMLYWIPAGDGALYTWIYKNIFQHLGSYTGSFLFGAWIMLTCWVVGKILDSKRIYVKV